MKRFYAARYHAKGPGEWCISDRSTDYVAWVNGKVQAYFFDDLLNNFDLDDLDSGYNQLFSLMFEKREIHD